MRKRDREAVHQWTVFGFVCIASFFFYCWAFATDLPEEVPKATSLEQCPPCPPCEQASAEKPEEPEMSAPPPPLQKPPVEPPAEHHPGPLGPRE